MWHDYVMCGRVVGGVLCRRVVYCMVGWCIVCWGGVLYVRVVYCMVE